MKWGITTLLGTPEQHHAMAHASSKPSEDSLDSVVCECRTTVSPPWRADLDDAKQPAQQQGSCGDQPCWVSNPPLKFAPPGSEFVPFPASIGMEGYWELDKTLSTPFPTPVHKMLKISAFGQHLQSLCPGVLVEETPDVVRMSYAPVALDGDQSLSKLPIHLLTHTELFHKDHKVHSHVGMARDVSVGRMETEAFLSAGGILYGRITKRGLMSGKRIDWICEDVAKVDDTGLLITLDQHVYDMKGRTASQRMVLRRRPKAAAKVMLKHLPGDGGSESSERTSELSEGSSESDE